MSASIIIFLTILQNNPETGRAVSTCFLVFVLITIISWEYLNLSLENEYVGDVTLPTQVIKYMFRGYTIPSSLHVIPLVKL